MSSPRELAARLSSVLEVIYVIFNERYSATTGDDLMRPALCNHNKCSPTDFRIGR